MEKTCERGLPKPGSKCWLQQKIDEDPNFVKKTMESTFFKLIESFPEGTEICDHGDEFSFKQPDGKEFVYDTTDKSITRTK